MLPQKHNELWAKAHDLVSINKELNEVRACVGQQAAMESCLADPTSSLALPD